MGGFGWVCCFGGVDWPGLGGLGGGWAGMTNSSPDWSESLSDSVIGGSFTDARFLFVSFAGNRVSHHGKFQCVGGLHPRTGIPWNQVCSQRRSFLDSWGRV